MNSKRIFCIFLFLLLALPICAQTEIRLLDNKTLQEFIYEISGIRAKDYVQGICQYNRTEGAYENTGYEKAVQYVMSVLEEGGVEEVKLHTYLSDGIKTYGTWRSHLGFRVKSARLFVVKPFTSKWCDFSRIPLSLMPYSNGDGVDEAEVIYVGRGTSESDYEGKEIDGKIVFVDRGDAATVMREAVIKRGALGIIMAFSGNSRRGEFPKLVELNRLYITGEEAEKSRWGFSLSKAQTESLKRLLDSNRKVVVRAEVDAETFSGQMPIISAAIKGSKYPDQEIVYMAHLDHYKPGANDNASGCAGLMEISIVLTKLINSQRISRPLRTMRFLWLPEWEGTAAYIENNREEARKGIVGINLDMIGEDLEKCQTNLLVTTPPLSQPSFLQPLVEYYGKFVDELNITTRVGSNSKFNYRIIGYFGESDHMMFSDAAIGVPSTMLVHLQDRFWHTSFDTLDKVDPTELERSIFYGTFLGWTAANYDTDQVGDLVELTYNSLSKKIESYTLRYHRLLKQSTKNTIHRNFRNINNYYALLSSYGKDCFESIFENVDEIDPATIEDHVDLLNKYVELQKLRTLKLYEKQCEKKGTQPTKVELTQTEKDCSQIFPKRLIDQCLNYWVAVDIMRQKGHLRFMNYDMFWEMLNFCDGENSLLQIRDAACAQFREIGINQVQSLFEILKAQNIVSY